MTIDEQRDADPTPQQLTAWLVAQQIDTTAWGQANAKSVDDLWQELCHGECSLQENPPLRLVRVVEVIVTQGEQILIEAEQLFADGRIRARNRPPSEKMKPTEDPLTAAQRCLQEELAVAPVAICFPPQEIPARIVRDESGSYPNLISEYTFYTVHAQIAGLPATTFTTPNAAYADGDPIVAHRWMWVARQ
ncbi:MAG: hypothetical protein R2867_22350 [Caldilineaceae bacterium]